MRLFLPISDLVSGPKSFAESFLISNEKYKYFEIVEDEPDVVLGIAFFPRKDNLLRPGVRLVHRLDGVSGGGPGSKAVMDRCLFLMKRADCVVYQSEFCKKLWDDYYIPDKWTIINNGANIEQFNPRSRKKRTDKIRLLSVNYSVFERKKLEVVKFLSEIIPDGFVYRVVGNMMEWENKVSFDFSTANNVEYYPLQSKERLKELFDDSDFLVCPAIEEPCSNLVIEALCSGLPVIYNVNSGGTEELVGEAGVEFDFRRCYDFFDFLRSIDYTVIEEKAKEKHKSLSSDLMYERYREVLYV